MIKNLFFILSCGIKIMTKMRPGQGRAGKATRQRPTRIQKSARTTGNSGSCEAFLALICWLSVSSLFFVVVALFFSGILFRSAWERVKRTEGGGRDQARMTCGCIAI